ncbi:MAG TPA: hypothetical protein VF763_00500 [Candidatus Limnocylindrales bacterium]
MPGPVTPELVRLVQADRERELREASLARSVRRAVACCADRLSRLARLSRLVGLGRPAAC